jgi:hypothetical protein
VLDEVVTYWITEVIVGLSIVEGNEDIERATYCVNRGLRGQTIDGATGVTLHITDLRPMVKEPPAERLGALCEGARAA